MSLFFFFLSCFPVMDYSFMVFKQKKRRGNHAPAAIFFATDLPKTKIFSSF